jgi:hypothetical protein
MLRAVRYPLFAATPRYHSVDPSADIEEAPDEKARCAGIRICSHSRHS